jgi:hypothetical protein
LGPACVGGAPQSPDALVISPHGFAGRVGNYHYGLVILGFFQGTGECFFSFFFLFMIRLLSKMSLLDSSISSAVAYEALLVYMYVVWLMNVGQFRAYYLPTMHFCNTTMREILYS